MEAISPVRDIMIILAGLTAGALCVTLMVGAVKLFPAKLRSVLYIERATYDIDEVTPYLSEAALHVGTPGGRSGLRRSDRIQPSEATGASRRNGGPIKVWGALRGSSMGTHSSG